MKIGDKFNSLTIIEKSDARAATDKSIMYRCKCDCGNFTDVPSSKLRSGHTKSCGCLKHRIKDLTGLKKDRLTVIRFVELNKSGTYWLVKCDCGNEKLMNSNTILSKSVKSCGCFNTEVRKETINSRTKKFEGTSISMISSDKKNKNNKSGTKGVSFCKEKNKWVAQISVKNKNIYLGRFDDINDAIKARKDAESRYYQPLIEQYEESIKK